MEPLVSILIPAHNAEAFIGDAIASAIAQAWARKEVVVVDDGSTDGTQRRAREFCSATVQVVHQDNQGAASARNTALSICQGDYIQWLDADDLLSPNKISVQMRMLADRGPNALASCAWGDFRYRPWKAKFAPSPLWADLQPLEWMLRKWETNSHMQPATWLVSRQLTEEAGPWDTRLRTDDDGEYFARVVLRSSGIKFAPDARVYYRVSPSTRLSFIGTSDVRIESQFLAMQLQIGYLRSLCDNQRSRNACTKYLQTWIGCFHPNRPDIVQRAKALAATWGGELQEPALSWKYEWIRRSLGGSAAKRAQLQYNKAKSGVSRACDWALLKAQGGAVDVGRL